LRRIVGRNVHAHSLRHTYASFLIAKRIELLSISKILGHENMNVTIEVYAHQLKELEEAGFGWVFDCPGIEIEEVE